MSGPSLGRGVGPTGRTSPSVTPDPTRLRGVLDQVVRQGQSLAVIAQSEPLLDAWGRALARSLRETPGVFLDLFMPATADALLARFNQLLADLPLERARAEPLAEQPLRVILVSDLSAFDTPEGALLTRLVTDFPGTNLRILLLADRGSPEMTERVFGHFGRRLRRVPLDLAPGVDSAPEAVSEVSEIALRGESRSAPAEPLSASDRGTHDAQERKLAARRFQPDIPIESARPEGRGRPVRAWFAWASVAIALLLISLLIVTLLHRDRAPSGGPSRAKVSELRQAGALGPPALDWRHGHV